MPKTFAASRTEECSFFGKFGFWFALALLLPALMIWSGMLPVPDLLDEPAYLAFHTASEIFAIIVAFLIFATGYYTLNSHRAAGGVILACAFLGVGLLDLLHTMAYPGMIDFPSPFTMHQSVTLWLAARLLAAVALLALVLLPLVAPQRELLLFPLLAAVLTYTAICGYLGVFRPDLVPATYIDGVGLTPFKIAGEWLFIILHLITLVALLRYHRHFSRSMCSYLAPALIILAAGGLLFTSYQTPSDGTIILAHLYKITGYLLLFPAILIENIHLPHRLLNESRKELALLNYALDHVNEAAYLTDQEGRFQYVNEGACRMLDYRRDELLTAGVVDVDCDFPMARWFDHWQELQAQGNLIFEGHHRDHRGRVFPVEINANYFEYDGVGYNLALVRDIRERKEAEQALAASHARLKEAQRIAHLGSWEWNILTNALSWSDEIYRIFGVDPQAFGDSYDAFLGYVHPHDRPAVQEAVNAALAGKRPYRVEHRLIREDGGERWVLEQAEVVRDASKRPLMMIGTVQDITERKQMEARELQTDKMNAMGLMAGGIAHDFNNILTPIMMHIQLALRQTEPNNPTYQSLEQVQRAAERAAALVRQILDFSHQGRHEPILVKLSVIIKEAVKFLKSVVPANIRMEHRINTRRDSLPADPTQLLQVLMNLCLNAIHAMGEKEGVLTITLEETDQPPDEIEQGLKPEITPAGIWLKLAVSDTGCGIPPEHISKLFDPFFTTKEKGEGTGMGLPVVHGIVTRHGGRIRVHSEPGRGSTFTVFLPTLGEDAPETAITADIPRGRGEHLLLVDDDPAVLEATVAGLTSIGYQVTTAADGVEALELLRRSQGKNFDLLLTDYSMPKLKGTDLAAAAHVIRGDLPIIMCTGYSSRIDETAAQSLGVSALVMKPLRQEILAAEIRRVLDQRKYNRRPPYQTPPPTTGITS